MNDDYPPSVPCNVFSFALVVTVIYSQAPSSYCMSRQIEAMCSSHDLSLDLTVDRSGAQRSCRMKKRCQSFPIRSWVDLPQVCEDSGPAYGQ